MLLETLLSLIIIDSWKQCICVTIFILNFTIKIASKTPNATKNKADTALFYSLKSLSLTKSHLCRAGVPSIPDPYQMCVISLSLNYIMYT